MNRKRILFVMPSLRCGGAERVMVHLLNHLDREQFAPLLAIGVEEGPYLKDLRGDIPIYPLGADRSRAAIPAILRVVRRVRPQAVITTLGFNFAVAMAKPFFPCGTRALLREGSTASAYLEHIALSSPLRARIYHLSHKLLYGLADTVICQSDFMLEDLAKTYALPRAKLARVYNPVDMERVAALAAEGENPFTGEGPHLLTIGHLYHAKGYDILLPAFAEVRRRHPNATLTFLGEGEDRSKLEAQAAGLGLDGAARFPGFEANPFRFLKHADLFISSSRYEGFANVILEAMACGTPVVATDCPGGNREVVEEGVTGWIAKTEDPTDLAATIDKALGGSLDGAAIQCRCAERFAVDRIVKLYEALF